MKAPLSYIPGVIDAHIEEAGFLSQLYLDALKDQPVDRDYLRSLSTRLRAHIGGLLLNILPSWERLVGEFTENGVFAEADAFFVGGVISFEGRRQADVVTLVNQSFDRGTSDQGEAFERLAFSMIWLSENAVYPWIQKFQVSSKPELAYIALYVNAWRNQNWLEDERALTQRLFNDRTPGWLLALATELILHGDGAKWVPFLRTLANGGESALSAAVYHSAAARLRFGDTTALEHLQPFVNAENPWREAATVLCFSHLDAQAGKDWLRPLQKSPGIERIMLLAIGALREKSLLPWVLNQLAKPELARLAGLSIARILAVDLEDQGWVLDDEAMDDAWLEIEGDEMLPWPDEKKIRTALKIQ